MPKIHLAGTDRVLEAPVGTSLLQAIQDGGHPIATSCGGVATCGLCRVTIKSGRENLSALVPGEITHIGTVAKVLGIRLACQAFLTGGDVQVEVPPVEDIVAKKAAKAERLRAARAASGTGRR